MREKIATVLSVFAAAVLVTLSAVFARSQNPPELARVEDAGGATSIPSAELGLDERGAVSGEPSAAEPSAQPGGTRAPRDSAAAELLSRSPLDQTAPADSARGRAVFTAQGCMRCHSVAGEGSPRYPLDGVGARRTAEGLRAWSVGAEVLADSLPPSAYRSKQAFQRIPEAELRLLVAFLSSLRQPTRPD